MSELFPTHIEINDEGDVVVPELHTPDYRRGQGEDADGHMSISEELELDHPAVSAAPISVDDAREAVRQATNRLREKDSQPLFSPDEVRSRGSMFDNAYKK